MPHYTTVGGYPNPDPYYISAEEEAQMCDGFTEDRVSEIGSACFRRGAQMCREMMARFVEQGGDASTAGSVRANWNPNWGDDPGAPTEAEYAEMRESFDPMREA